MLFMKKMILLFLLIEGGNTLAFAVNDGHLDGVWLNARIKTTIPKALYFPADTSEWGVVKSYPIDTGKDNCFIQLNWNGADSYSYDMNQFCLNGNGQWEHGEFADETTDKLIELSDGSLGSDWTYVYFPQLGRTFADFPDGYAYTGFEGTLILTPSFNSSGAVKNVKATGNAGMIYSWDSYYGIGGTARSTGLKLKFVKTENVPAGAITCAAGGAAPLCP
jgi:hypothetical protein